MVFKSNQALNSGLKDNKDNMSQHQTEKPKLIVKNESLPETT
jgi:hypothetical protein